MAEIKEGMLLGFGNPLLDITIVTEESFLRKYDLKANNAILAEEKHQPMFDELIQYNPDYVAGGATQNSIRVAQWLLQKHHATTFFGCIGNDENGKILAKRAEADGVNVRYQVDQDAKTGVCGAIITGEDRSLVADLRAANKFSHTFIQQPENWKYVEDASVYYIGGFPFSVSPETVKLIAAHACANDKLLVMNLSAPFLIHYFVNPEINIIPYIDVLFGNETEAATFCEASGIQCQELSHMALAISKLPKKNTKRERTVIFTQGREPTVVAHRGTVFTWPINPIAKELIKDTNGCGDAFVGGFLSQAVQGKPIEDCLRCGNYAARTIIQHFGCTYPPKPDFS